jgi:hypothetical protein
MFTMAHHWTGLYATENQPMNINLIKAWQDFENLPQKLKGFSGTPQVSQIVKFLL